MKKIYKITGACMLTAVMLSCNKRLDEYNPSGASADAAWSTPQGFVTNVNGAYQEQRSFYGKEDGPLVTEGGTDLWFNANKANYSNQTTRYLSMTGATPGNGVANMFRYFYRAINVCNAGIGRIDNAGFTDAAEKNRRLGELRFLRAFYYWHIVEFFGGVMLRTTETTDVNLTATRSPVSAFYELIIGDLRFAADNLPNASFYGGVNGEYSRASKKSALGMLARVYLSRAYYATGQERTDYLNLARNTANDVITRRAELGAELWASPADLWNPANNKNNKEALYIISNSTNVNLNYDLNANRLHAWYLTTYANRPGLVRSFVYGFDNQKRLQPTRYLLNLFNEQIDGRYAASFQETWVANATSTFTWTAANATTYGKAATVVGQQIVPGTSRAMEITKQVVADKATKPWVLYDINDMYNTNGTIKSLTDFVPMRKFIDLTRTAVDAQPGYNDIMVIRLAEMYLISAEAEFQLGNFAAAATQLNVLRTRAAVKTPIDQTAAMQVTAAQVQTGGINFILDERARELCGEHLRWFDLKRTLTGAEFVSRIKTCNPDIVDVQDYHRLRPVPLTELNALQNGAEFGQNPGYPN